MGRHTALSDQVRTGLNTRPWESRRDRKRASTLRRAQQANIETLEDRTLFSALYWDPSGAATANGGSGTWNTSATEWRINSPTGALVAWNNSAGYDAVFPATGGTVSLGTSITAKSLTFNASGYAVNSGSGTLTLSGGTGQIDVASGDTATINANISGSSMVTKVDSGILTLAGPNSYTGGTVLSAGQLNINSATAIGSGTFNISGGTIDNNSAVSVTLSTNNTQIWGGNFTYAGSYSLNLGTGNVTLGSSITITASNKNLTIGGTISGSGYRITKSGYGGLMLNAANTFTGQTTLVNGDIQLGTPNALQDSTLNMNTSGSLVFSNGIGSANLGSLSGSYSISLEDSSSGAVGFSVGGTGAVSTYSGVLSGTGSLTENGGTETLSGANTYSGGTTVTSGTLKLSGSGTLGSTSGSLTVNGGTLDLEGTSQTAGSLSGSGGTILNNDSGTSSTLTVAGGSTTYAGVIANNTIGTGTLALNTSGSAALTFTGTNTYTGVTTVGSGSTLKIGAGGTAGTLGGGNVTDNGTLAFNRSNAYTFSNAISGSGTVTQSGGGTATLSVANSYSGTTTVSAGTLLINNASGSGTGTGAVTVDSGATLGGTGTMTGSLTVNSGGTLAPGSGGTAILSTGNLTLASGSYLDIALNGNTAGTNYDQINVSGNANVSGSNLVLSGTRSGEDGTQLNIVNSTSTVTGMFAGLPQGSAVGPVNGVTYTMNYSGGGGDDIVLTASPATPAAPSGLTATGISYEQINLSWTNNATNQTGFYVERSSDGTNFSVVATLGSSAVAYSDTNSYLEPGGTYYYRVAAFNAGGTSSYTASAASIAVLPSPAPYYEPNGSPPLPTGADVFAPPMAFQNISSSAPTIAASNLSAGPDDTVTLTGEQFTDDSGSDFADTRFIVYGQTNSSNRTVADGLIQDPSQYAVLTTLPQSEPNNSMYFVWPENSSGVGAPIAINQTDAQWLQTEDAVSGGTVAVYGQNLDNGASTPQSWVYIQPTGGTTLTPVTVTSVNPYQVQFTLPTGLTPGATYTVWVYNGHGGNYGWSGVSGLTIAAAPNWSAGTTINISSGAYNNSNNGTTDAFPAISAAISTASNNSSTLYTFNFSAGTYFVNTDSTQYLNVIGDGMEGSYSLGYNGGTATLTANACTSEVQTALNGLLDPGGSEITVTELNSTPGRYEITFSGFTNTAPITLNTEDLTGTHLNQGIWGGVGQIQLPSNVRLQGQVNGSGVNQTTILFPGNVPNEGNHVYCVGLEPGVGVISNVDLESINITYSGPSVVWAGTGLVCEQNATDLTFNNVVLTGGALPVLDCEGSLNLTITNSTLIGQEVYVTYATNIFLDHDNFYQAYDQKGEEAINFMDDTAVVTTNCTTENYYDYLTAEGISVDPEQTYNGSYLTYFSENRFLGYTGNATDTYAADNTATNLGDNPSPVDPNSGEEMGTEVNLVLSMSILGATESSVTVAGDHTGANIVGQNLDVTSGPGFGQHEVISLATYNSSSNTSTLTISGAFLVTPSVTGSTININGDPTNMVYYDNTLDADAVTGGDASVGIQIYEGADGVVIDGNTISNTIKGVVLQQDSGGPSGFCEIINNTISGVVNGIVMAPNVPPTTPNFYGLAIRNNNASGGTVTVEGAVDTPEDGIDMGSSTSVFAYAAIEHNDATGFQYGIAAAPDPDVLLYKNTIVLGSANSSSSIGVSFAATSANALFEDNAYVGYTPTYGGGSSPTPTLSTPYSVFYETLFVGSTSVLQPISLQNQGVSSLNWSGTSSACWLTFQTSNGSIAAESATPLFGSGEIELVANPSGLSAGNYFSTVTITFDSTLTRKLSVEVIVQ